MQKIWSVVDLLCQNPQWWSLITSSTYGLNLERRILGKILYEVYNSDIQILSTVFFNLLHFQIKFFFLAIVLQMLLVGK
jgi:hypothetical protein